MDGKEMIRGAWVEGDLPHPKFLAWRPHAFVAQGRHAPLNTSLLTLLSSPFPSLPLEVSPLNTDKGVYS